MATPRDRILLAVGDPVILDFIGRQSLQAAGYAVAAAATGSEAAEKAAQINPDVIIADLHLPGLSGKDLLVALNAQGIHIPVIILAKKGQEAAVIQTFRLGAADYLLWPAREAEVIAAVERLLAQSHERRERESLSRKLQKANTELQQRVRELTAIFSVGKAVTTVIDQAALFEKILDGALTVTQGEFGWFLLREEKGKAFAAAARRGLPAGAYAAQPLDEGICSLVSMSGESLSIAGEPLRRFRIYALGQSALITPVKVQKQVIGLLVVMRHQPQPFTPSEQGLLEAVGDYASISLVNARLFRALEDRARSLQSLAENAQAAEKIDREILRAGERELAHPLERARALMERLTRDPAWWSAEQKTLLERLSEQISQMGLIAAALSSAGMDSEPASSLNNLVELAVERVKPCAIPSGLTLNCQLPADLLPLPARPETAARVLDALLINAVRRSPNGGQIQIRLEKGRGAEAQLVISDSGAIPDPAQAFAPVTARQGEQPAFVGFSIGLPLAQEIAAALGGKLWLESSPKQECAYHFSFPLRKSNPPTG